MTQDEIVDAIIKKLESFEDAIRAIEHHTTELQAEIMVTRRRIELTYKGTYK